MPALSLSYAYTARLGEFKCRASFSHMVKIIFKRFKRVNHPEIAPEPLILPRFGEKPGSSEIVAAAVGASKGS